MRQKKIIIPHWFCESSDIDGPRKSKEGLIPRECWEGGKEL